MPTTSTNVNAGYLPYTYEFDLGGKVSLAGTAQCIGYNVSYDPAAKLHKTIVTAGGDACSGAPYTVAVGSLAAPSAIIHVSKGQGSYSFVGNFTYVEGIYLLSITGELVTRISFDKHSTTCNFSTVELPNGIYYLCIANKNQNQFEKLSIY
jgi:hypothetical protein